ncbi:MAG: hypothetical protein WC565_00160 [Parcubacteria group bacterium]
MPMVRIGYAQGINPLTRLRPLKRPLSEAIVKTMNKADHRHKISETQVAIFCHERKEWDQDDHDIGIEILIDFSFKRWWRKKKIAHEICMAINEIFPHLAVYVCLELALVGFCSSTSFGDDAI